MKIFWLLTCSYVSSCKNTFIYHTQHEWEECSIQLIQYIYYFFKYFVVFLAPPSRRLEWAIVIGHRPLSFRPSSGVNFHIFNFSSETNERNSTKLDRKQDLNALYQVCVFRADRENKMAALASDWLRHFRLLLWNRWTEFNETWQEARSQCPLPSLCLLGRSEKQDGRPGLWLAETFSTSPLKPLNRIQRNLTGSKISTPSTKFVFLGLIGKTRWPPWPLIGRDIFDFPSETAEPNSTKLDRKQDLNALCQVCVFGADRKNKMAALASDWLRHFRLLLWNRWTKFNETWQEARSQSPLPSLCFLGRSEKQDGRPDLWLVETFSTSLSKPLNRIQRILTGSKISTPSTKFVFFGPIVKTRWLPGLWLAEIFSTFPLKPLNWIQWNLTGSKISTPSTKFVFFGMIGKTKWPPWPLIGWEILDFSSETAEWNSAKIDRKQALNAFYQGRVPLAGSIRLILLIRAMERDVPADRIGSSGTPQNGDPNRSNMADALATYWRRVSIRITAAVSDCLAKMTQWLVNMMWLRPWEKGSYGFDVRSEILRHKVTTSSVDVVVCFARREFSTCLLSLRSLH